MILHNGPIYTMDPRLPQVRALAVADTLIAGGVDVREGDADTVGHERIDLDGRCVLPGFSDSHVHFLDWALERQLARPARLRQPRPGACRRGNDARRRRRLAARQGLA